MSSASSLDVGVGKSGEKADFIDWARSSFAKTLYCKTQ